jgi:hypothetical protein
LLKVSGAQSSACGHNFANHDFIKCRFNIFLQTLEAENVTVLDQKKYFVCPPAHQQGLPTNFDPKNMPAKIVAQLIKRLGTAALDCLTWQNIRLVWTRQ